MYPLKVIPVVARPRPHIDHERSHEVANMPSEHPLFCFASGARLALRLLLLVLWSATPLAAQPLEDSAPPRQPPLNLLQASERVRDALGGEVIKAELIECKGRPIYTIRLLQRGYIREVLVDAASGKMLLPEEDEAGMEMTD
jgi:uncharacterized membrane protein YkoI